MTLGRCWRLRGLEWGPPPPFQADRNATRAAITAEPWRLTFVASSSLAKKRGLGWGASSRNAELYGAQLVRGVTALALAVGCGSVDIWNNFTFGIVISLVIAAVMVIAGLMVISVPGMAASREMIREVTAMAETCDGRKPRGRRIHPGWRKGGRLQESAAARETGLQKRTTSLILPKRFGFCVGKRKAKA